MCSVGPGSKPGDMPNDADRIPYKASIALCQKFFVVYLHIYRAKYLVPRRAIQMTDPKRREGGKDKTASEPE